MCRDPHLDLGRNGPKEKGGIETRGVMILHDSTSSCRNGPKEKGGIETDWPMAIGHWPLAKVVGWIANESEY